MQKLISGLAEGGRLQWQSKKNGRRSAIVGCNDGVNGFDSQDDQFINDIERDQLRGMVARKNVNVGCVYLPASIDAYFHTTSLLSCTPFGKEGSQISIKKKR